MHVPTLEMLSQNLAYSNGLFGRTEGKKRQKHKLNLCSLMQQDKIFALFKRLQRELAAALSAVSARVLMSISNPALASLGWRLTSPCVAVKC